MQALEFDVKITNGLILMPEQYKGFSLSKSRIIILGVLLDSNIFTDKDVFC